MSSYKSRQTKAFVLQQTKTATRFAPKSASDIWRLTMRKRPETSVQLVHFHLKNLTADGAVNRVGKLYQHPDYAKAKPSAARNHTGKKRSTAKPTKRTKRSEVAAAQV